jgi:hypothetical protein
MSGHVYRVSVFREVNDGGVVGFLDHGDAFTVEGKRYARRPGGALVPAGDDWHDTAEAAYRAAAPQLVDIVARITAQAARWQEGRS